MRQIFVLVGFGNAFLLETELRISVWRRPFLVGLENSSFCDKMATSLLPILVLPEKVSAVVSTLFHSNHNCNTNKAYYKPFREQRDRGLT